MTDAAPASGKRSHTGSLSRRHSVRRWLSLLAVLSLAGCDAPTTGANTGQAGSIANDAASIPQTASTKKPARNCFVTVPGWQPENQALYGACYIEPWQGLVGSTDMPALFAQYKLPGNPPLLNPTGYADHNVIEYRLTWLGAPNVPTRIGRWRAPREVDCSRRLGTSACYTEDVDPVLSDAGDFIAAAQRGNPNLKFYWDAERAALLAQYEPWDLYTYAVFYVGDVQVSFAPITARSRIFRR